jgi:hypothetical protein
VYKLPSTGRTVTGDTGLEVVALARRRGPIARSWRVRSEVAAAVGNRAFPRGAEGQDGKFTPSQ